MNIRQAQPGDCAAMVEFNALMAEETEGKTLDRATLTAGVTAMLADPNKGRYFVAEEAGQLLGQIGITDEWSDWRNGFFWWIQSVYVHRDARRRGIFTQLYEHVRRLAQFEANVIGIRLYVEHDNGVAQATYAKLGMTMTSYGVMEECPLRGA